MRAESWFVKNLPRVTGQQLCSTGGKTSRLVWLNESKRSWNSSPNEAPKSGKSTLQPFIASNDVSVASQKKRRNAKTYMFHPGSKSLMVCRARFYGHRVPKSEETASARNRLRRPKTPGTKFRAPKPQTPNSNLQTPNPNPQTPNPKPQTPNPKPQTPNPKPQTPNPKPQTPNPKPQTLNPKP